MKVYSGEHRFWPVGTLGNPCGTSARDVGTFTAAFSGVQPAGQANKIGSYVER